MNRLAGAAICFFLAGCASTHQSALDPAGPQAGRISGLFWLFTALCAAVFAIVIGLLLWTLLRRQPAIDPDTLERVHAPSSSEERRLTRTVAGATIATTLILIGLVVASVTTGKAISNLGTDKNGIAVEVTGNQWWWQIRYLNDDPSRIVVTANEIHIPAGRPVMIRGTSHDVIHSFWIPNLHGKVDLIPSHINTQWIQADHPGRFRGQCAEFCGAQHAHMALWVVADSPEQFEAWMNAQLQTAVEPADPNLQQGQQVFLNHACAFCHTIAGTTAKGSVGPDLTHFASRSTIAAGSLPNTKGHLGGWIEDPQNIKPGNHMATVDISASDLQPLLDYLESLR